MAKIRNSKPKHSGGGYERLLGNANMARIFTQAQSTVISNGTELEKIISNKSQTINDLDLFIDEFALLYTAFLLDLPVLFIFGVKDGIINLYVPGFILSILSMQIAISDLLKSILE